METYNSQLGLLNQCAELLEELASKPPPYPLVRSGFIPNTAEASGIATFERTFDVLHNRVQNIFKLRECQHSLLSPFRKVPDEVIYEIFSHLTVREEEGINMTEPHGIWAIREVCARWRDLVNSSPRLWSKFSYGRMTTDDDNREVRRRTELCLRFSGSAPLSVSITPYYTGSRYGLRRFRPREIFDDIMKHSNRLHRLKMDIHLLDRYFNLNEKIEQFSQLKILRIEDTTCRKKEFSEDSYTGCRANGNPFEYFKTATALEVVELDDIRSMKDAHILSWTNVKSFNLADFPCGSVIGRELLRNIPNLQSLTSTESDSRQKERFNRECHWLRPSPKPPKLSCPITLPSLRHLHIQDMGSAWSSTFLVPHLTNFKLSYQCMHYPKTFITMIRNSGCTLKSVDMYLCSKTDAKEVLQHLPDVEDLTLSMLYAEAGTRNLAYLIWNPKTCSLLPSLKKLKLTIKVLDTSNLKILRKILIDIIQSRSLSVVRITFQKPFRPNKPIDFQSFESISTDLGAHVEIDVSYSEDHIFQKTIYISEDHRQSIEPEECDDDLGPL